MEYNNIIDTRALSFEIESANPRCTLDDLKPELVSFLEKLYVRYPFHINSAYRSIEHERSMRRDGSSSHCKGLAVDIRVLNSVDRLHLLRCAMELGCSRFGIASNYIHMDLDREKPACIWTY